MDCQLMHFVGKKVIKTLLLNEVCPSNVRIYSWVCLDFFLKRYRRFQPVIIRQLNVSVKYECLPLSQRNQTPEKIFKSFYLMNRNLLRLNNSIKSPDSPKL